MSIWLGELVGQCALRIYEVASRWGVVVHAGYRQL